MARVEYETQLRPLPTNKEELERCLADPEWRLFSGCLYKIMIKQDEGDDADVTILPFIPNRAQRRFIARLWHRNLILKARQMGFTTLIAIMWLDHALFNADQRCGIIAQDRDAAKNIFRDKVKFAYERLPEQILARFPVAADNADELLFDHNNSSIRVATSMRSGTIHRLHVSEFGKICAKFPDKADEVVTGSIPTVPTTGVLVIESTAEGKTGGFADMVDEAKKLQASRKTLTPKEYRFHFYAWWQEPKYRLTDSKVPISPEDHDYFDKIEAACGCKIDPDQRAWYMATLRSDFSGKEEKMWQEYPSTPEEAFQVSIEGNYYGKDMLELRRRGGVTRIPVLELPVYTFWDIGNSDGCAIWFMQSLRGEDRFIDYYEAHNEDLRHYAKELQNRGYLYAEHLLPHDADHKRLGDFNQSIKDQLQKLLPGQRFIVVPRITEISTGIYLTRKALKGVYFDEERAGKGIARIEGYRKKFSRADNRFLDDQPDKSNGCSEGADALRQYAQAKENGQLEYGSPLTGGYQEAPEPDWRM